MMTSYAAFVREVGRNYKRESDSRYQTADKAKLAAFDFITRLLARLELLGIQRNIPGQLG